MKRFSTILLSVALTLLAMISIGHAQTDAAKLKALADAYVAAWNSGNVQAFDAIIDKDFVRHTSPGSPSAAAGLDSLKHVVTAFRAQYPDFKVWLTEEIYAGEKIVVRWAFSATHSGLGMTTLKGKKVQVTGISIIHVKSGKLAEEWVESDGAAMMTQLGFAIVPPAK